MAVSPIETRYAGCRFRSRLEARHGVLLDHLGITWEYEPQGFVLPSGARYLPDFRLPELKLFLEIKGTQPGPKDLDKVREFAVAAKEHGYVTLMLVGDIPRPQPDTVDLPARAFLVRGGKHVRDVVTDWMPAPHASQLRAALTAARSARFEFGESGAPKTAVPKTHRSALSEGPGEEPPWGWKLQGLQEEAKRIGRCSNWDSASCVYDYGPQGNPFVCVNPEHRG